MGIVQWWNIYLPYKHEVRNLVHDTTQMLNGILMIHRNIVSLAYHHQVCMSLTIQCSSPAITLTKGREREKIYIQILID